MDIDELIDQWQDVYDRCEPDDYLERELIDEFIGQLKWLKRNWSLRNVAQ